MTENTESSDISTFESLQREFKDTIDSLGASSVEVMSSWRGDLRFMMRTRNEALWHAIILEYLKLETAIEKKPFRTTFARKYFTLYEKIGNKYTLGSAQVIFVSAHDPSEIATVALVVRGLLIKAERSARSIVAALDDPESRVDVEEAPAPWRNSGFHDIIKGRVGNTRDTGGGGLDRKREPVTSIRVAGAGGPSAVTNRSPSWDPNL